MTKQQRLVLVVSILASAVSGIDGFIVNVALPTIARELHGGLAIQQWVVDAYLLTLGAFILIAGSLSDLFGRKRILLVGLIWFGVASLLCALAPNGAFLVVARALQGVGGALLVPSSLAIIISTFKGAAQGRAIGIWTAWFSVSAVLGPLLGGLILAAGSWRWIFAINVLPIALTVWLLLRLKLTEQTVSGVQVDLPGAILCAVALGAPVFALIEQPTHNWGDPLIYGPLALGLLATVVFILFEQRAAQPMLPLSLFKVRNFTVGNLATLAIYAGLAVSSFILTITLQQVGGYSALAAGLAMLPVTFLMFFLSSRFGALAGRYGPRIFMTLGPLTAAVGFLLMLHLQLPVHYLSDLLPGILVFGLGLSITVAPLTSAVLGDIAPRHAGVASAVNNAVARVAGLVAVAFVGVITGTQLDLVGYRRVLVIVAGLLAVGGIISLLGIRTSTASSEVAEPISSEAS
jgi:EmrB/QacA subfamily drug resistance transporter